MFDKIKPVAYSIITALSFALIIMIILFSNQSSQIDIKSGDVSDTDIFATRAIVDTLTTEAAKKAATDAVADVYVCDDSKRNASLEKLTDFFAIASSLRSDSEVTDVSSVLQLKATAKAEVSEKTCKAVINASDADFSNMRKVSDIVNEVMTEGVGEFEKGIKKCTEKINSLNLTAGQKTAMAELISSVITTNLELDRNETLRRKEVAANSVAEKEYKKNQIILRKGEIASDAQIAMLEQLGLLKGSTPLSVTYTCGLILMALLCYIILMLYFSDNVKLRSSSSYFAILGILSILITFFFSENIPEKYIPLIPAGIFVSVITIFSNTQTAIVSNLLISVFCGIAINADWEYSVTLIIAGTLSAYCFGKVKRRSHLLPSVIVSSVMYGLTFCAVSFIQSSSGHAGIFTLITGFIGGLLSGIITIGSIPFWEWIFNATTPMKLTELANPENKLLKKLLIEAPGTYHHSLTVANISEIAAREIGADSLLARVGAYYHDIGKLRHPLYFKENQYDKNTHDTLSPEDSASVIINHVTDGADIAAKYRLPQSIRNIIIQHHGTTTTGYFLIRAKEKNPDIDASIFTYPGPPPLTREAAIVMLADSCEAAVRSLTEKNDEKIEAMVRKIATERVNSGQFSKCPLTFAELETVIRVISHTLGGYFHERIKYE